MSLILGQQVEFSQQDVLHRTVDTSTVGEFNRVVHRKVWKAAPWFRPALIRGVVIGIRTLSNGQNKYHGYDEPIEYCGEEFFSAYVIAYDLRRKPVYVLGDNLTII